MRKFKIFYSWQSDLPGNKTRNFIRSCIDDAIELAEETEAIEADRDEATLGMTGSPDIVTSIFSKIDDCDLFIADISLCFTETQKNEKKSPNPNVMLELGYAVKTLGWDRVLCVCNVDYGEEYPFDIAHNRITRYSLEGQSRKEIASDVSKLMFINIRDIRKLPPKAKKGMATHLIGAYNFDENTVIAGLSPITITDREGYMLHNQKLVYTAQELVSEIQSISVETAPDIADIHSTEASPPVQAPHLSSLQALVEQLNGTAVPVLWKEEDLDKSAIMHWLGIEVSNTFFDLGGLKRVMPAINISEPSLRGTNDEIRKYNKLRELEYIITQLHLRTGYLKTFDGMCFIPLAIQNISAVPDENIRVVVNVNAGEIIEPDEHLIWSELEGLQGLLCRDDDDENDVGVICELFSLPEDGIIHIAETPFDPERIKPRMPIFTERGIAYLPKNERDYALELQEFIAKANGRAYYEFDVDNLRPGECKWLCGLLIRPVAGAVSLTYQIYSAHSAGDLSEILSFHTN